MNDPSDTGISVAEMPAEDQSIPTDALTTAAFIGRARSGPLDHPVSVRSFSEFTRRFGGHWRDSGLAPAVEQFFAHGGRRAIVVRVANGAVAATLTLAASDGEGLTLVALHPGSAETFRASVDYDAIDDPRERRFNLTVQRISPQTRLIDDQEIFRNLTVAPDDEDNVVERLLSSRLVRAGRDVPSRRPDATRSSGADRAVSYVIASKAGSDGHALTDYDLIGCAQSYRGLFALQAGDRFDLLYAPSPGAGREPGPAFLLAAERFCRQHGATLIMDPPADWGSQPSLRGALSRYGFRSDHVVTYFPRLVDRRQPDDGEIAAGGALAGLMARNDERGRLWVPLEEGAAFLRGLVPARGLDESELALLRRHGVNALIAGEDRRVRPVGDVTFSGGAFGGAGRLCTERLARFVLHRIEHSTRWVLFHRSERELWQFVERQVADFLDALAAQGAFQGRGGGSGWFARCNSSTNAAALQGRPSLGMLLGFRPACEADMRIYSLVQEQDGCRISPAAFAGVTAAAS